MAQEKAVTTKSVVSDADKNAQTRSAQAEYDGNHHMDKVDVKITKDSKYFKKGQTVSVHPTTAAIFKQKGIIGEYKNDIKRYNAPQVKDGQLV